MAEEPQFHSMNDIREYIKAEAERQVANSQKKLERWRLAKKVMWLLLLVAAYLQYFFIDVIYKSTTLPSLEVSVPVRKEPTNTRTGVWVPGDLAGRLSNPTPTGEVRSPYAALQPHKAIGGQLTASS